MGAMMKNTAEPEKLTDRELLAFMADTRAGWGDTHTESDPEWLIPSED